jgi:homoserine kinase
MWSSSGSGDGGGGNVARRVSLVVDARAMPTERPHDVPLGMPSPEALQMATDADRRRHVLPEAMQHPEVRAECVRLAYLVQAYGLASRW